MDTYINALAAESEDRAESPDTNSSWKSSLISRANSQLAPITAQNGARIRDRSEDRVEERQDMGRLALMPSRRVGDSGIIPSGTIRGAGSRHRERSREGSRPRREEGRENPHETRFGN